MTYRYCNEDVPANRNFTDIEGPDGMVSCAEIVDGRNAQDAQIERLRNALRALGAVANDALQKLSPQYPDVLNEDAQSEIGLWPGDLGDPA